MNNTRSRLSASLEDVVAARLPAAFACVAQEAVPRFREVSAKGRPRTTPARTPVRLDRVLAGGANLAAVSRHVRAGLRAYLSSLIAAELGTFVQYDVGLEPPTRELVRRCRKLLVSNWKGTRLEDLPLRLDCPSQAPYLRAVCLVRCPNLRDISLLARVGSLRSVEVALCPCVDDLAPLAGVRRVSVTDCRNVVDVSPLSGAHYVALCLLPRVVDLGPLDRVHSVDLTALPGVVSIAPLARAHTLRLAKLPGVQDWSPVGRSAVVVDLFNLDQLRRLPRLGNARAVSLSTLPRLQSLAGLEGVYAVTLKFLGLVSDLSPLRSAVRVVVCGCPSVTDVSPLASADTVALNAVQSVRTVAPLNAVPRLYCDVPGARVAP